MSLIFAQCLAAVLAVIAVYMGWLASVHHDGLIVFFNVIMFFANVALFIWQGNIRRHLNARKKGPWHK